MVFTRTPHYNEPQESDTKRLAFRKSREGGKGTGCRAGGLGKPHTEHGSAAPKAHRAAGGSRLSQARGPLFSGCAREARGGRQRPRVAAAAPMRKGRAGRCGAARRRGRPQGAPDPLRVPQPGAPPLEPGCRDLRLPLSWRPPTLPAYGGVSPPGSRTKPRPPLRHPPRQTGWGAVRGQVQRPPVPVAAAPEGWPLPPSLLPWYTSSARAPQGTTPRGAGCFLTCSSVLGSAVWTQASSPRAQGESQAPMQWASMKPRLPVWLSSPRGGAQGLWEGREDPGHSGQRGCGLHAPRPSAPSPQLGI